MSEIRLLGPGDEPALERFLATHPDTTMFLRGNLQLAGIVHTGEPYSATYVAAFEGPEVVATAAHSWGGNLLVEAPTLLEPVARAALESSGRALAGIVGSGAQVQGTRVALGLQDAPIALDSCEDLFALDLAKLVVPEALRSGDARCRAPHPEELEKLAQWRVAYSIEILGDKDSPKLQANSREAMQLAQAGDRHWVLDEGTGPVSYSAFNATLPDCVQIGGVYTPPELRSVGRARAVVAGSLLLARERGVLRSLLFTGTDNQAAQRAYRALGYQRVGDYAILLFEPALTSF